ncbi:hypothetical protein GGI12_000658 [Dipsacomyces acuminosporus]|nr:hypothetical protein GGI12_000658 [Dipsacomyces acuminosporus]
MKLSATAVSLIPALLLSSSALAATTAKSGDVAEHSGAATPSHAAESESANPTGTATKSDDVETPAATDCPESISVSNLFFSQIVSSNRAGLSSAMAKYPNLSSKFSSINDVFTKDLTPDNLKAHMSTMQNELAAVVASNSAGNTKPIIGLTVGAILAYAALF